MSSTVLHYVDRDSL